MPKKTQQESELKNTLQRELVFDRGTLLVKGEPLEKVPVWLRFDPRVQQWRAPALRYRELINWFREQEVNVADHAASITSLDLRLRSKFQPHPYQTEAVNAWNAAEFRGSVILPTGSGKTFVALKAMEEAKTSTLVVAPTIDLMSQWYTLVADSFGMEVGILGGGYHDIKPLTVTTYDSAYIYAPEYGDRFGLLVFDEVHHLPSPKYIQIPRMCVAPYRLGLTATYERQDGAHRALPTFVGPVVYSKDVTIMRGKYLADYQIVRIKVELTDEEEVRYEQASKDYYSFIKETNINPYGAGWQEFVKMSAYDPKARKAFLAKNELKKLTVGAERKLEVLDSLLKQHARDKVIIFTEQNDLVYRISMEFLIPAITHQTRAPERKWILDSFRSGVFGAIATSKVLNEGIDVPEAKVAIILSGSASPREHLQRLGRILRKSAHGGDAILYEIVASGTMETNVSHRRRQSDAYA